MRRYKDFRGEYWLFPPTLKDIEDADIVSIKCFIRGVQGLMPKNDELAIKYYWLALACMRSYYVPWDKA